MKKPIKPIKLILLITLAVIVVAVATFAIIYFCRPKELPSNVNPQDNQYIDGSTRNIDECTPKECLYILAYNLKHTSSYSSTLSGEVDAGIYKQTVGGEKYKVGDASLYVSRSTSAFVNTADQIYIENDTVLVRKGDPNTNVYQDTVTKYTLENYLKEYGTDYRELCNYVIKDETITNAKLVSITDGVYKFEYEIDVNTGVYNYRVNMYKMGSLSELPNITKSTLVVEMDSDFKPISVTMIDTYTVNMIFTFTCNSTLTERYVKIDDASIDIPDVDFFKSKLGE